MKAILSMILLGTLIAPATYANEKGEEMGKRKGGGFGKILKQLNLTDDQKAKLKEFRKANKGNGKIDHSELKKLREEMKSKFATSATESEIRGIQEKIKKLRHSKGDMRFSRVMGIRNILTVEQRKKFQELQQANRGMRKHSKK
jgi:Spy/CpxP family protein refolding chaperone